LNRLARVLKISAIILLSAFPSEARAQQSSPVLDPTIYSGMRWRLIGPHRGGRVSAVAGIFGDPATFYMGTPGGGVWKTTDGGQVWKPIFDDMHVASIGAIAVAPSNPNIIYVGTGEQTAGNGVYKSTDAGVNWTHIGLDDTRYISSILVDPRNPDIVIVGVLGHPILSVSAPSPARGVFKSVDGGKIWKKPDKGLPDGPWGRTGIAIVPGNNGRRLFSIIEPGLFRSDDAGATWRQITKDPRVVGSFYFSRVFADPRNADVVYVMQTSAYRSTDGGQTFASFKGAPGGDDYHVMWIDPQNSSHLFLGVDQGAIISLDAGETWSSWFNQPTGQFYDVVTDNQFPFFAYASQQDSGTAAVPSRSDYGGITFRDWFSFGGFEFCSIAPDPLNPNIVYSGGWFGSVVRFDKTTGQVTHVFAPAQKYHHATMPPIVFSPQDSHTLYYAAQFVLITTDAGQSWQEISPDLTVRPAKPEEPAHASAKDSAPAGFLTVGFRQDTTFYPEERRAVVPNEMNDPTKSIPEVAENFGGDDEEEKEQFGKRPPSITTLAPSPLQAGVLWAGTSNGLIQLTQDNATTWINVSPSNLTPESQIISIEPSHFDAAAAYVIVEIHKDLTPYIYRTRDAGKSWQKITSGLAPDWVARAVREDPARKGLLYAATENSVYVSFDDGDHWQSLQLNLPTTDVRDLAVHGNDLVAATYGRALWILDDLSPLRQSGPQIAASDAYFLHPADAVRVRWDNDQETPLPPEVPAGKNPPDGAILYYFLKSAPSGELTIEIRDLNKNLVRRFTSVAPPADTTPKNVPEYWFAPPSVLTKNSGLNRIAWDLRYDPPPTLPYSYWGNSLDYIEYTLTINAIPGETPVKQTLGPLVVPGKYEVTFIGGGVLMRQPLVVLPDPRIRATQDDLVAQFNASQKIVAGLKTSYSASKSAEPFEAALADRRKSLESIVKENPAAKEAADALNLFQAQMETILDGTKESPGFGYVNRDLARLSFMAGSGDAAPSAPILAAIEESCSALAGAFAKWRRLSYQSLPPLNAVLAKFSLAPLPAPAVPFSISAPCAP
jgi:photosystem II stability/assembly factor-like uncharacterized protein